MKRLWLIEYDLMIGVDGYALEGQRDLERYLAKVAAFQAAHPEPERS